MRLPEAERPEWSPLCPHDYSLDPGLRCERPQRRLHRRSRGEAPEPPWDWVARAGLIRTKVEELLAAGAAEVREEHYADEAGREILGHVVMLDPGGERVLRGLTATEAPVRFLCHPGADGQDGGLYPVAAPSLVEDVTDVSLNRRGRQVEAGGDLGVGEADSNQGKHIGLAHGQ